MAYIAPKVGEGLFATQDRVGVYLSPSVNAERTHTNDQNGDHSLRDYRKGELIGQLADDHIYPSLEGGNFLKITNFVWVRVGGGLFGGGVDIPEPHEAYLNVDDEPLGWIRDTFRLGNNQVTEHEDKSQEIITYLKNFPGVPAPTSINKQTDSTGKITWLLTFPNGYSAEYDLFVKLSPADKLTLTTRDTTKPLTLIKEGGVPAPKTDTKSTVFTTTNILIGVGILALFGGLLALLLRKKR